MPAISRLKELQSTKHATLLGVVDYLRAEGFNKDIPLPQLIVCGDQSSGKSSVLEAISGVPFPRRNAFCTRFATEVVLRYSPQDLPIHVSINPGSSRSVNEKKNLQEFQKTVTNAEDLEEIIQVAKDAMGLGIQGSTAFATDVLRVEIAGPLLPRLTIVDLPGLIHSENRQQSAEDVALVSKMVEGYMAQQRSIILAIVSAKNDYANQVVLKLARSHDPTGQRTLGIITKPDLLWEDSESQKAYIDLARNQDVYFKLGWHVVKNPDTDKTDALQHTDRDVTEQQFFANSRWNVLDTSVLGAANLRQRLGGILFTEISHELPTLCADVSKLKFSFEESLRKIGPRRVSEHDQRLFLVSLYKQAAEICRAASIGNYDHAIFTQLSEHSPNNSSVLKLRSRIENANIEFTKSLQASGAFWRISQKNDHAKRELTFSEAVAKAATMLKASRGQELSGTYNPMLIGQLFKEWSQLWSSKAQEHILTVWKYVEQFLHSLMQCLSDEIVAESMLNVICLPQMNHTSKSMGVELDRLLGDIRGNPTTYNHYFTDTVHKQKRSRQTTHLLSVLRNMSDTMGSIHQGQFQSIAEACYPIPPDMDLVAAEDMFIHMQAYYKVALKRFCDNLPILIVNGVIIRDLLALFDVSQVLLMPAEMLQSLAGESPEKQREREALQEKIAKLSVAALQCQRHIDAALPANSYEPVALNNTLKVADLSFEEGNLDIDSPTFQATLLDWEDYSLNNTYPKQVLQENDGFDSESCVGLSKSKSKAKRRSKIGYAVRGSEFAD